jgi:hypothetical protein
MITEVAGWMSQWQAGRQKLPVQGDNGVEMSVAIKQKRHELSASRRVFEAIRYLLSDNLNIIRLFYYTVERGLEHSQLVVLDSTW